MSSSNITLVSEWKSFGGDQKIYSHISKELQCTMKFSIYIPPGCTPANKFPVVYWLSGLTCDETNFIQKAGAQRYAAELGLILVCPDTSPRGVNIAGEDDSWDFGSGAGFYVDATTDLWRPHYRMYSYVTSELIQLIGENFPVAARQSITGHSMGGHGALVCALRNPGLYASVSALAPICNPIKCPWGQKAFTGYLGEDRQTWSTYDATELVAAYKGPDLHIFIDQGVEDNFLKQQQLLPENLVAAAQKAGVSCESRMRDGYDHSYFYVASVIGEHLTHHAKYLKL